MHQPLPQEKLISSQGKVTSGKFLYLYHPEPTEKWFVLPVGLGPFLEADTFYGWSALEKEAPDEKWVESPGAESLHSPSLNLCPWNSEAPGGLEREEALLNVCFFTASLKPF